MKQTAKIVNCSVDTIRNILNTNNIDKEKRKSLGKSKAVEQYSLDGILLNTFSSCRAAAKYIAQLQNKEFKEWMQRDISRVASGERKKAYNYIWKYKEEE